MGTIGAVGSTDRGCRVTTTTEGAEATTAAAVFSTAVVVVIAPVVAATCRSGVSRQRTENCTADALQRWHAASETARRRLQAGRRAAANATPREPLLACGRERQPATVPTVQY